LSAGSGSVSVAAGGSISLSQGIAAGAGVSLSGTSIGQVAGASILAGSGGLQVAASSGGVQLDDNGNRVGSFSGSALGDIHFHDAGALTLGALTSSTGFISVTSGGALVATQAITAPGGVDLGGASVSQTTGASITSAGGLSVMAASGGVSLGDSGNNVASFTGSASGDISFFNAGSLALAGLSSSTGSITIASGGALSLNLGLTSATGVSLSGTSITQAGGASIVSGGGLLASASVGDVLLQDSGNDVASVSVSAAGSIAIYNAGDVALGSLSAGSGSIAAGSGGVLTVSQSISGTSLALSGASVTQAAGASITSGTLAVAATSGGITLLDGGNNVAAFTATAPGDIKFFDSASLSLGSIASSGGSVSVASAGTLNLSQSVSGATGVALSGSSVSQSAGASVVSGGGLQVSASSGGITLLDGGNAVSWFTASAPGAIEFANASSLMLKSLSSGSSINVASGGALTVLQSISAPSGVTLAGQSVSQTSGASVVTGGLLQVSATAGDILLGDSGNSVGGSFQASATGNIQFYSAGDLTLGSLSSGGGSIGVGSGGALIAAQSINAGNGIFLASNGTVGQDVKASASLHAGSGGVSLYSASGSVLFNGTAGIAGAGDAFFSAPTGAIRVASGTTTLASNVGSTEFIVVDGGTLNAGANITIPNLLLAGGTLQGANVTIGSHLDWTGGTMAGSGKTLISGSATADITGPVTAARPMVNDGSIFLWGSGNVTVGSGFSLVNNGLFEILNDGGFIGGVGSIVNSGTFRKGSTATAAATSSPLAFTFTTGSSAVEVASFSNTGTLEVMEGTLQFSPMAFTTNAGLIWLESGATLDNSNTTLANTGWIKGSGTLALGTGSLDNSGGLAPGGLGAIGSLAIQAATVNLQPGSTLLVDVADALNYDTLQVTGDVSVASGAGISPSIGSAALLPGDSFDVVASSAGTVGGTVPTVSGFDAAFVASPASLRLSVPLPPPPAPAPVASGSPLVDRILEIVPDASPSLVTAMLSEQDNTLTTFTTLLLEEEQAQAKDAVVNEVSGSQICTP
jgi:hypothetical protein